jgi:hypothetical protein
VVGVEDQDNEIVELDFDDSHIQNLVNAYLENPPKIQYENVPFPNLPKDRVIGLVTVKPKITPPILKGIHTILTASLLDMAATQCLPKRKSKIFKTRRL